MLRLPVGLPFTTHAGFTLRLLRCRLRILPHYIPAGCYGFYRYYVWITVVPVLRLRLRYTRYVVHTVCVLVAGYHRHTRSPFLATGWFCRLRYGYLRCGWLRLYGYGCYTFTVGLWFTATVAVTHVVRGYLCRLPRTFAAVRLQVPGFTRYISVYIHYTRFGSAVTFLVIRFPHAVRFGCHILYVYHLPRFGYTLRLGSWVTFTVAAHTRLPPHGYLHAHGYTRYGSGLYLVHLCTLPHTGPSHGCRLGWLRLHARFAHTYGYRYGWVTGLVYGYTRGSCRGYARLHTFTFATHTAGSGYLCGFGLRLPPAVCVGFRLYTVPVTLRLPLILRYALPGYWLLDLAHGCRFVRLVAPHTGLPFAVRVVGSIAVYGSRSPHVTCRSRGWLRLGSPWDCLLVAGSTVSLVHYALVTRLRGWIGLHLRLFTVAGCTFYRFAHTCGYRFRILPRSSAFCRLHAVDSFILGYRSTGCSLRLHTILFAVTVCCTVHVYGYTVCVHRLRAALRFALPVATVTRIRLPFTRTAAFARAVAVTGFTVTFGWFADFTVGYGLPVGLPDVTVTAHTGCTRGCHDCHSSLYLRSLPAVTVVHLPLHRVCGYGWFTSPVTDYGYAFYPLCGYVYALPFALRLHLRYHYGWTCGWVLPTTVLPGYTFTVAVALPDCRGLRLLRFGCAVATPLLRLHCTVTLPVCGCVYARYVLTTTHGCTVRYRTAVATFTCGLYGYCRLGYPLPSLPLVTVPLVGYPVGWFHLHTVHRLTVLQFTRSLHYTGYPYRTVCYVALLHSYTRGYTYRLRSYAGWLPAVDLRYGYTRYLLDGWFAVYVARGLRTRLRCLQFVWLILPRLRLQFAVDYYAVYGYLPLGCHLPVTFCGSATAVTFTTTFAHAPHRLQPLPFLRVTTPGFAVNSCPAGLLSHTRCYTHMRSASFTLPRLPTVTFGYAVAGVTRYVACGLRLYHTRLPGWVTRFTFTPGYAVPVRLRVRGCLPHHLRLSPFGSARLDCHYTTRFTVAVLRLVAVYVVPTLCHGLRGSGLVTRLCYSCHRITRTA